MIRRPLLLASLALCLLSACTVTRQLVASDGSHRMIARDTQSGVTVVLTTEAWESGWKDELTIVHVLVSNNGNSPVLLAPGDFEMRDERGFRYSLHDAGGSFSLATPEGKQSKSGYDPGGDVPFETIRSRDGELERLALPWGTLLPGTQMRGFLYFDDVRETSHQAVLVWHAQSPDHRKVADLAFRLHIAV